VHIKNIVDNAKNMKADLSSAAPSLRYAETDSGDVPQTEAVALNTCTPLTTTATAPWPDMTACTAVGPNREASAITAGWRYDPAVACNMLFTRIKEKKTPGEPWINVVIVRRNVRNARHRVAQNIRREGED